MILNDSRDGFPGYVGSAVEPDGGQLTFSNASLFKTNDVGVEDLQELFLVVVEEFSLTDASFSDWIHDTSSCGEEAGLSATS